MKSRLTPAVTPALAAVLARAFFADTLALARRRKWARVVVAYDGDTSLIEPTPGAEVWLQGDGDLGERMERILRRALCTTQAALAIGTDSPGLPPEFLDVAHRLLADHDAVLGPCSDGGYYLLGLRRCPEGLLHGLPWSVATTRERTSARLREWGFHVAEGEPWFDVDRPSDLVRLAKLLGRGKITAPNTALVLETL